MSMGLANSQHTENDITHSDIIRVLYSSGSVEGWISKTHYGSSDSHGGSATFCLIEFHTLRVHHLPGLSEPGCPISSDTEERNGSGSLVPTIDFVYHDSRHSAFLDRLEKWCFNYSDRFLKISSPGHPEACKDAVKFSLTEHPIYFHAKNGECLRAAVANVFHAITVAPVSCEMLSVGTNPEASLASCGVCLEQNVKTFRLQNPSMQADVEENDWLLRQNEDVFPVRLHGMDVDAEHVDHVIFVDAGRKLLWDSVEKCALRLDIAVLAKD